MIHAARVPSLGMSLREWFEHLPIGTALQLSGRLRNVHLACIGIDGSWQPAQFFPGEFHCASLLGVAGNAGESSVGMHVVLVGAFGMGAELRAGMLLDADTVELAGCLHVAAGESVRNTPLSAPALVVATPATPTEPEPALQIAVEPSAATHLEPNPTVRSAQVPTAVQAPAAAQAAAVSKPASKPMFGRPQVAVRDDEFPEQGDVCEHFAFGRCEVLLSDGERLHLRSAKDGRIKEIALSVLDVVLTSAPGDAPRVFQLTRKR